MKVVDDEGKELEKVECPKCKGTGRHEETETKAPGQTHTKISLCPLCHGLKWIWVRKEEIAE